MAGAKGKGQGLPTKAGVVASMTGFARAEGENELFSWSMELKSVNARNLDQRYKLPWGHDELEARLRTAAAAALARGNLQTTIVLKRRSGAVSVTVNQEALAELRNIMTSMKDEFDLAPSSASGILALPGVLEESEQAENEEERAGRLAAMEATFTAALGHLLSVRQYEGLRLKIMVEDHLSTIEDLVGSGNALAETQPEEIKGRLKAQVETLLEASPALPEERLAQEAALLATKADIREELDRLSAHCEAARSLLGEGRAIGRRLDFLCQEFNREANTLCSKASSLDLTRIGLDLKSVIEQMREQIQNIE